MENPHYETGSQDLIIISAGESSVTLQEVIGLRFILKQPSPEWKSFNIEESVKKKPREKKEISLEKLIQQTNDALRGRFVEEEDGNMLVPPYYDINSLKI